MRATVERHMCVEIDDDTHQRVNDGDQLAANLTVTSTGHKHGGRKCRIQPGGVPTGSGKWQHLVEWVD